MDIDPDKQIGDPRWLMVRTCLLGIVAIAGLAVVATTFDLMPAWFPMARLVVATTSLVALLSIMVLVGVRRGRYATGRFARFIWCWALPIAYVVLVFFVAELIYR